VQADHDGSFLFRCRVKSRAVMIVTVHTGAKNSTEDKIAGD
jgi:hypothetical protein